MLIAGVIHDKIEHEPHVTLLDAPEQFVEVGHGAELAHDLAVVANVVSVIGVRRVVVRAQRDDVDAKALDVIQLGGDALKITDSVTVRIFERSRIDLVDNGLFPPLRLVTIDHCGWSRAVLRI
jgi:hypothetical protein